MLNVTSKKIIHKFKIIIYKLSINNPKRIKLIQNEEHELFVKLGSKIVGKSLQSYIKLNEKDGIIGFIEFSKLILGLEISLNLIGASIDSLIDLIKFIPKDKQAQWLQLWQDN